MIFNPKIIFTSKTRKIYWIKKRQNENICYNPVNTLTIRRTDLLGKTWGSRYSREAGSLPVLYYRYGILLRGEKGNESLCNAENRRIRMD